MWLQTNTQGLINMDTIQQVKFLFLEESDPVSLMLTTVTGKELPLDFSDSEMCMSVYRGMIANLQPIHTADISRTMSGPGA